MKISSADIPHKSDMGGVRLGIRNADEVREAFALIMDNAAKNAPGADIDGIYVQKMLAPAGMEVIIGVNNDPQFGPAVLVGLGGIFPWKISATRRCFPRRSAKPRPWAMLESLKAAPLFKGYRGKAPLDMEALARMVANVSRLAAEKRDEIAELDINPVFVYEKGQGVRAADALAVLKA